MMSTAPFWNPYILNLVPPSAEDSFGSSMFSWIQATAR